MSVEQVDLPEVTPLRGELLASREVAFVEVIVAAGQPSDIARSRNIRLSTAERWRRFAACRGRSRLFYAADTMSETIAVAVCTTCGVREACAADAADTEADVAYVFGVRAGMTAGERRRRLAGAVSSPVDAGAATAGR